ncbi:MAG TPA: PEP-CTERM sorting domain-containing protein [Tepidisphaeraceae bacterium]|jgi:hypothetical protein
MQLATQSTLLAAALFTVASHANAAILAQYTFDGGSAASTDTDLTTTASPFTLSGTGGGFSSSTGNAFLRSGVTGADAAAAAADTDFLSFTVTAAPGLTLDLETLSFNLGASNNTTVGGPDPFANTIYVTAAGSSVGTDSFSVGNTSGGPVLDTTSTLDLSGAAFDGLTSITFRFAFSDNADLSDVSLNRLDNVVLNGTAAVPEPTAMALLGLGSLVALRRRRAV